MPEKLLTLQELSSYLGISEEKIVSLVEKGVISAYKVGGEFLRFRRDQIDVICSEISSQTGTNDKVARNITRKSVNTCHERNEVSYRSSFGDNVADFFYFYDFYIIATLLIAVLLVTIFYL
ncbi:MAG: excisionase family DNA-binding protein [Candidatus Omnitrophica bacterium]|nr:excisionase family DNA-binding protein [Candidatus Omnitrophota bacterium]MBU1127528.1 excisionase family DNA-binding protein [Candidatus Omnitrophota bacterium]MBU1783821.1 excisionase family DNA-binding protein [Candidatus Omnitrophota bacterium]MBU1851403.1 excisionase family DNA-binding protein [Candidatus Omnitrophota bacterium]